MIRVKSKEEKLEKLHEVLKKDGSDKVLIFREMKHSVDSLTKELAHMGFKVGCIHGDKRSRERIRILDSFKKDQINILIATDVAARGLGYSGCYPCHQLRCATNLRYLCAPHRPNRPFWQKGNSVNLCASVNFWKCIR